MENNILRTLQRLAATTKRFSGKQKFVKFRKTLYRYLQYKSDQKSGKILVEKHIFSKIADSQPAKNKLHYEHLLIGLCTF